MDGFDLSLLGFREDFDPNNRKVKLETFEYMGVKYKISTVDLGLDHSYGEGPPLYYETMIFQKGNYLDLFCERYETREQAEKGHKRILEDIKNASIIFNGKYFEYVVRGGQINEKPR